MSLLLLLLLLLRMTPLVSDETGGRTLRIYKLHQVHQRRTSGSTCQSRSSRISPNYLVLFPYVRPTSLPATSLYTSAKALLKKLKKNGH